MKFVALIVLIIALAIPASASSVVSWTHTDISGHNLTLNYTSSFNVAKNDTLGIIIKNVGNESLNDTITVYEINVSSSGANGVRTLSETISPNSSKTFPFDLNVTKDTATIVDIKIYYNISLVNKTLNVTANYPGAPKLTSRNNSKTNNDTTTLTVNTNEIVTFEAFANQPITNWSWVKDNVILTNNTDHFSTSWDSSGNKTLSVNATNANGTSDTITWNITVQAPAGGPAPIITSWNNSKTNDSNLNLTINESETIMFNFTANQTLTSWLWKLNDRNLSKPSYNLTYTFNDGGFFRVGTKGSNANGTTQPIVWNVTVLEKEGKKNATIHAWWPQVVDYVYVNGTVNETIEYSITTAETMSVYNWSVDGKPVIGDDDGNTYYHNHTWDNNSINNSVGFHTVIFRGNNTDTKVEFRWYVNVYEIGEYRGGNLFDVIDDALENHVTDLKIRMFKYKIAKHGGKSAIVAQKVKQLHDEIAKRQMTREALRDEFKAGNISIQNYTAALRRAQFDAKFNSKLANEMAKIAKEELKDEESGKKFEKLSEKDNNWNIKNENTDTKVKSKGLEKKSEIETGKNEKEDIGNQGKSKENNNGNKNKGHGD